MNDQRPVQIESMMMNKSTHDLRWTLLRRGRFGLLAAGLIAFAGSEHISPPVATAAEVATNRVESVATSSVAGVTLLRINLQSPIQQPPQAFLTQNPLRLAIDLPGVTGSIATTPGDASGGEIRSVSVAATPTRSRVIAQLKRPVQYTTRFEGNAVIYELRPITSDNLAQTTQPQASQGIAWSPSTTQASSRANEPAEGLAIRDIDFRRGDSGEARILIDLSSPAVGGDVRLQGGQLIVDFPKARMPENLRRRFDVTDFGTPVRQFTATQAGDSGRLVLQPSGLWEHAAYQSDKQFVIEIRPLRDDPNRLNAAGRGYRGEKLSLNFQNIEVRALLQVIADFTNLNIIATDSVGGTLTLRLKDVPWDQALDIVLQTRGLDMRRNGNVIWVAPREELAAKEKLELEAKQQIAELEPLRTEVFQLNYQKADALGKLLSDDKQRVLSRRGSAVVDQRTNQIFVQDTASRLEEVRKLVARVDVPVRQVLIEARIVEADDRFSRNLGARLGYNDLQSTAFRTISVLDPVTGQPSALNVPIYGAGSNFLGQFATVSGSYAGVQDLSAQNGSALTGLNAPGLGRATAAANTQFVNLPAAPISGAQPGQLAISLFGNRLTRFVNLELSALEAEQRGKVVSSPRVLTADQGRATIEQGTELPFQQATASGATSIAFRRANLRLDVTPQITPEGNVILDVEVNRDAVGQLTPAGFAIDTRRVKTMVLVENGGTIVIGGIYEQFERNRVNKVPLFGDLPILGHLFRNTQRTNDRNELLVFLTPRVVTDANSAR